MATIPIHNPQLPFLGLIPGGLRPSVMLRFRGVVHHEGRLQINIQCGAATEPRDDVALHLSIRPKESAIVRNHCQSNIWGPEERYGHSPIYFGQPFDLLVLAEHNQYKLAVNGNHFCTFSHRIPLTRVTFVSVSGQGMIHFIGLENDNASAVPTAPPISNLPMYPPPGVQICPMPPVPPNAPPYPSGPGAYPPHGGVPVYPGMPGMGVVPPPPPYTPSPYPGGNMSGSTVTYPASTDPYRTPPHQNAPTKAKGIIEDTKSFINNIIGNKTKKNYPAYPTHNAFQQNPYQDHSSGYPAQPGMPNQPQYYPGTVPQGQSNYGSHLDDDDMGGHKKGMKKSTMFKYAAGAGAVGLGGYALHKAIKKRSSSSSSSSSSD